MSILSFFPSSFLDTIPSINPTSVPDGLYLKEVDRVLRPGGYWILSGPPINWKTNYKAWQRPREELEEEQRNIEEVAKLLCWKKKYEKGEIAIWQKSTDPESCQGRQDDSRVTFCNSADVDNVWYISLLNLFMLFSHGMFYNCIAFASGTALELLLFFCPN